MASIYPHGVYVSEQETSLIAPIVHCVRVGCQCPGQRGPTVNRIPDLRIRPHAKCVWIADRLLFLGLLHIRVFLRTRFRAVDINNAYCAEHTIDFLCFCL